MDRNRTFVRLSYNYVTELHREGFHLKKIKEFDKKRNSGLLFVEFFYIRVQNSKLGEDMKRIKTPTPFSSFLCSYSLLDLRFSVSAKF